MAQKSFVIKSFTGMSEFEDKGLPGAFKYGQSLDVRKTTDSLSCQQGVVDEGAGVVVDLVRFIIPCTDTNSYGFGNAGKIYKRTSAGVWSVVYTDTDGAITGAAQWFLNNGKEYLFWTTATKLKCKEIPGNTGWSDVNANAGGQAYPKTNLTSSTYHTMVQAVGSLMICNGNFLAMVGYDGSYTPEAVDIYPTEYTKTLIERGNYVVIGCPKDNDVPESDIVEWNTTDNSINTRKNVKGGAINALIDTDQSLMQVGTKGAIYYGDLQNVLPIVMIHGGGYCDVASVTNDDGLALFGIGGNSSDRSGIYSYGRKELNRDRTLNMEYLLGTGSNDVISGALCKVGSDILMCYEESSSFYADRVDSTSKATGYYYSLDLKAPTGLNYVPIWGPVILNMKALPAGCSVECYYKLDKDGDFIQAKLEGGDTTFSTTDGTEAVFLVGEKAKVFEVELKLTPSTNETPEIYQIEILIE